MLPFRLLIFRMNKKAPWIVLVLTMIVAGGGYFLWQASCERGPVGPLPRPSDPPPETLPLSQVDVPISIETGFLATEITKQLPSPLAQGKESINLPISVAIMTPIRIFDAPRDEIRKRIDQVPVEEQVIGDLLTSRSFIILSW